MKNKKINKQKEEALRQQKTQLVTEIMTVQEEMAVALNNFSDTIDPELVDYYSYYYKANQIKYGYLMRQLKKIYYLR